MPTRKYEIEKINMDKSIIFFRPFISDSIPDGNCIAAYINHIKVNEIPAKVQLKFKSLTILGRRFDMLYLPDKTRNQASEMQQSALCSFDSFISLYCSVVN